MLEKETAMLKEVIQTNEITAQLLTEKKQKLLNQEKKKAQDTIHEMNEQFEQGKKEKQQKLLEEISIYEQEKIEQTRNELLYIQKRYEDRKETALKEMIKEVLAYDYRENE